MSVRSQPGLSATLSQAAQRSGRRRAVRFHVSHSPAEAPNTVRLGISPPVKIARGAQTDCTASWRRHGSRRTHRQPVQLRSSAVLNWKPDYSKRVCSPISGQPLFPSASLRLALHSMYYNFARIHQPLRCTLAIEAGVSDHVRELEETFPFWIQTERDKTGALK
jgi:hypothetical protein